MPTEEEFLKTLNLKNKIRALMLNLQLKRHHLYSALGQAHPEMEKLKKAILVLRSPIGKDENLNEKEAQRNILETWLTEHGVREASSRKAFFEHMLEPRDFPEKQLYLEIGRIEYKVLVEEMFLSQRIMKLLNQGISLKEIKYKEKYRIREQDFDCVDKVWKERQKVIVEIKTKLLEDKKPLTVFREITQTYPEYDPQDIHAMIRLEQSKKDVLSAVNRNDIYDKIKDVVRVLEQRDEPTLDELMKNARKALAVGNFVRAEFCLNAHRDLQRGIVSRYIRRDANGNPLKMPLYLADARNVLKESEQRDTFENWASMGLSYFRIALKKIDLEIERLEQLKLSKGNIDECNEKIEALEKVQKFITEVSSVHFLDEISTIANAAPRDERRKAAEAYFSHAIREKLVPYVAKALIGEKPTREQTKKLQKEFELLRDFGALERKPFASVTLTQSVNENQGTYVIRADVPVYQLTQKQQKEIRAIIRSSSDNSTNLPAWYKQQTDPAVRAMIRRYAPAILEGRDLPTQMLQFIPFLRNAKQIQYYQVSAKGEMEKYFDNYGTGNIGSEIKGSSEEDTIEGTQGALEQLEEATGAKKIYLQSLVTPSRIRYGIMQLGAWLTGGKAPGDEVTIDSTDRKAVTRKNTGTKTPSFFYRVCETLDKYNPFGFSVTHYFYGKSTAKKGNYESLSSDEEAAKNDLAEFIYGNLATNSARRINNPDMTAANAVYQEAISFIDHAKSLPSQQVTARMKKIIIQLGWLQEEFDVLNRLVTFDDDNRNMQLAAKEDQMVSLMRQYHEECVNNNLPGTHPLASSTFCKSAKDRAGMAQIAMGEAEARFEAVSQLDSTSLDKAYNRCISDESKQSSVLEQVCGNTEEAKKAYRQNALRAIWQQIKGGHVGRSASNQSAGNEGIKNTEGIIPKWLVGELSKVGITQEEDLRALLERHEAHYNSKVKKPKEGYQILTDHNQWFEMEPANTSDMNQSLGVCPQRVSEQNLDLAYSDDDLVELDPEQEALLSKQLGADAKKSLEGSDVSRNLEKVEQALHQTFEIEPGRSFSFVPSGPG